VNAGLSRGTGGGGQPQWRLEAEEGLRVKPGEGETSQLIMPGLDPGILSDGGKEDPRVKPGGDE
jgi:hypothetical protein